VSGQFHAPETLPPGKEPPLPIEEERVIKSVRLTCAEHVERMGELSSERTILVGKPDGMRG